MRETGLYLKNREGSFTYRVGAFIIQDGKLLTAKSIYYPCFYTVGGVVEMNETSQEAVVREVFEETGFKLEIDRLFCVQERIFTLGEQRHHEINLFYLMKTTEDFHVSDQTYTDQAPEETLHWIPLKDIPNIDIVPESLKSFHYDDLSGITHIISRES